jgi:hypothetical protein
MPIKVIELPPARYPGEILTYIDWQGIRRGRDLSYWVDELDLPQWWPREQVDSDHLHRQRTLAAFAELRQRG